MNDPWDVKCVRQAGQYVSCMKINGVPLLPPVLSKECRKEMQYYKLLAREVEKRISLLQPYFIETDSESEDKTDAPEMPESEQSYEPQHEEVHAGLIDVHKISAVTPAKNLEKAPTNDISNNITSNLVTESDSRASSPKLFIDLNVSINETGKNNDIKRPPQSPPQMDLPERDYNCTRRIKQKLIKQKEVITEVETHRNKNQKDRNSSSCYKNNLPDHFTDITLSQDGPSSLSSKSFTGSLNDLHSESNKDLHIGPLVRQRSYTLLNPSPQLLAHLEEESLNTGVQVSCISMSESLSNMSSPNKKRRSWDLETAKVKWSSMALELKQTNVVNNLNSSASNKNVVRSPPKKPTQFTSPPQVKSGVTDKTRRKIVTPKPKIMSHLPKSEPIARPKISVCPASNANNRTFVKEPVYPKPNKQPRPLSPTHAPSPSVTESEDPATRVRELYEKIQNQQLLQMATLVEKQKKEQLLLQQVFEEQNNMLFKQLKTICPKSPIEVKEAWGEKLVEVDRGPVSLSQLINHKSPVPSSLGSPVTSTLTNTNNYINHCDNMLKKSRDITGSIKKQPINSRIQNGTKNVSPRMTAQPEGNRTRTHSPSQRNTPTSRRLNYDTSGSYERDCEPMLTDRTNDTMADLNVTFPSDTSDDCNAYNQHANNAVGQMFTKEIKKLPGGSHASSTVNSKSTDNAIRNMERTIHNSINSTNSRVSKPKFNIQASTPAQRAAATKLVAVAKGYLVRRLMRTERVQATVQTIKDALLCALQLHQDREGIRGADVDLHRRLIQQITAACYSLHDAFVASTTAERCAMIAADRARRRSISARQANSSIRQTDLMSQSHSGAFPARAKRPSTTSPLMTQSNYETFNRDKGPGVSVSRYMASPHRRPWR